MVGWFGFNAGSAIAVGKDYLPVAGVHGVGGALGALLVGVFCMRPVLGGL